MKSCTIIQSSVLGQIYKNWKWCQLSSILLKLLCIYCLIKFWYVIFFEFSFLKKKEKQIIFLPFFSGSGNWWGAWNKRLRGGIKWWGKGREEKNSLVVGRRRKERGLESEREATDENLKEERGGRIEQAIGLGLGLGLGGIALFAFCRLNEPSDKSEWGTLVDKKRGERMSEFYSFIIILFIFIFIF